MRLSKLRRHLLYAGLEKEEYEALGSAVSGQNRIQLTIFSMITLFMLIVLALIAKDETSFGGRNRKIYLAAATVCILIAWLSLRTNLRQSTVELLITCFEAVLYLVGIAVSVAHVELPAVTEIAFLLIVPMLFIDRPVILGLKTAVATGIFCLFTAQVKASYIAQVDTYNALVFSVAAVAIGLFLTELKVRYINQGRRIEWLSETDVLTGLKNRNSYEAMLRELPELCHDSVTCVYGDANGLHELNNSSGHAEGDRMLRTIAGTMKQFLGDQGLFRVGGDEFVFIRVDAPLEEQELSAVTRSLAAENYHVSFGLCSQTRDELDVAALIRQAERQMYQEKDAYYARTGRQMR